MPVRIGFGMPFWNRLFAGAGWSLGRSMPSVRLVADGGRLLPLGIVAALPLQLSQRPNGIDFCLRHTPTLKKHQLTTSVSCSQIRYLRVSQHMRCSSMYDDDDGDAQGSSRPGHPPTSCRPPPPGLLCTAALLGDFPTIEKPNGVAIACSLQTRQYWNTPKTPSCAWRLWTRH